MPIAVADKTDMNFVQTDHLGTPRLVTDASQTTLWRRDGDAFGATPAAEDPDGDGKKFVLNQRFSGQYFDEETGFHYNYFRSYDPSTGSYVTGDPIGLKGGINTYGYVDGSLVNLIDPSGQVTGYDLFAKLALLAGNP